MVDSPPTQRLLEQIRNGDRSAIGLLMDRHRQLLLQFIELRLDPALRQRVDPSDVIQETQMELIRRLDDFLERAPMPFSVWARKTAYQNLLRLRRRHLGTARRTRMREISLPSGVSLILWGCIAGEQEHPLEELVRQELALRVQGALNRLPELDREILLLRAYEGLENQSVAALLELDPRTTSKRYARALLKLRRELLDEGATDLA